MKKTRVLCAIEMNPQRSARFWASVPDHKPVDECWEWHGPRSRSGYGLFRATTYGTQRKSNRIAWTLKNGPIPEGMLVLHKCDNPPCCNPAHLFLGTDQDNVSDKIEKNRQPHGSKHWKARLNEEQAKEIAASPLGSKRLASLYGVSSTTIIQIKKGRAWSRVTGIGISLPVVPAAAPVTKLTPEQAMEIYRSKDGYRKLAKQYGVCRESARAIKRGETWRHVTGAPVRQ